MTRDLGPPIVKLTLAKITIKKSSWLRSHLNHQSCMKWQKSLSVIKIAKGVMYTHDDAIVVTFLVTNYMTKRILIDNGKSMDILLWEAFAKMNISPNKLKNLHQYY